MRLRDELWFKGRDWFQERLGAIPQDDALIAELTAPTASIRVRVPRIATMRATTASKMITTTVGTPILRASIATSRMRAEPPPDRRA